MHKKSSDVSNPSGLPMLSTLTLPSISLPLLPPVSTPLQPPERTPSSSPVADPRIHFLWRDLHHNGGEYSEEERLLLERLKRQPRPLNREEMSLLDSMALRVRGG